MITKRSPAKRNHRGGVAPTTASQRRAALIQWLALALVLILAILAAFALFSDNSAVLGR